MSTTSDTELKGIFFIELFFLQNLTMVVVRKRKNEVEQEQW